MKTILLVILFQVISMTYCAGACSGVFYINIVRTGPDSLSTEDYQKANARMPSIIRELGLSDRLLGFVVPVGAGPQIVLVKLDETYVPDDKIGKKILDAIHSELYGKKHGIQQFDKREPTSQR